MRNVDTWRPTKFEQVAGGVRASRDVREVAAGSRLIADLVGAFYSTAIPRFAFGRLLDLGCGKAPLYGFYRRHVTEVTLVDWANSLHDNPHLDVIQDLNEPLQFDAGRFDTVLLSDVLEHIAAPDALLAEIARVLTPGGVLLMNVPFLYGLHEQPHDYFRYTRHALERLLVKAGFEVVDLSSIGGLPEVVTNLTAKALNRRAGLGGRLALALQTIVARLLRRGPVRELSRRTREDHPLGYTVVARRAA